jgi:basic amino acid/polyamine antiporter, APA family
MSDSVTTTSAPRALFVRKATGLVREISTFDALLMNLGFINIALGALTVTVAPFAFVGDNLVLTMIATTLFALLPTTVYAMFASAMPRSGGDYLFVGRVLHPVLGFVANFNTTAAMTWFTGILASWISGFALSDALITMGTVLHNTTLTNLSGTAAGRTSQLVIGGLAIALFTWLVASGSRRTFRFMAYALGIMFLAQIVTILVLAGADHGTFVQAFGKYANYNSVISAAKKDGFQIPVGFSLLASLGAIPIAFSSIGFGIVSSYVSGEVKAARRSSMTAMLGSVLIAGGLLTVMMALATRTFGNDFLGAIGYLGANDPKNYPLPTAPFFYLFVGMLSNNVWILGIIGIGFILAIVANIPPTFLLATRNIFAWSFDRYFPKTFADVSEKTHTPVKATILVGIYIFVSMAVFIYAPTSWTTFVFSLGIASYEVFFLVSIAAIILPWRRPQLYRTSPYARSIAGVPLITILGVGSGLFNLWLIYSLLTNGALGANSGLGIGSLFVLAGLGVVLYVIARIRANQEGVDLSLAGKEIPPE